MKMKPFQGCTNCPMSSLNQLVCSGVQVQAKKVGIKNKLATSGRYNQNNLQVTSKRINSMNS